MSWIVDKDFGAVNLESLDSIKPDNVYHNLTFTIMFTHKDGEKTVWLFDTLEERDKTADIIYEKLESL